MLISDNQALNLRLIMREVSDKTKSLPINPWSYSLSRSNKWLK